MAQGPIFLERQSYRKRRMTDAVRLLPFLGLLMCMVPLAWPKPAAPDAAPDTLISMSTALQYLFGIWLLLVVLAWLLWRRTARHPGQSEGTAPDDAA